MAAILQGVGKLAATAGFVGVAANSVLFNVDAGCRGVIFDRFRGVLKEVKNEGNFIYFEHTVNASGTHFLIPFVQTPHIYDVKTNPKMIRTATGSNDLQTVNVSLRILYRPEPAKLPQIYSELGLDYDERVLPSITNEVLKVHFIRPHVEVKHIFRLLLLDIMRKN
jgi:prohibitin 1